MAVIAHLRRLRIWGERQMVSPGVDSGDLRLWQGAIGRLDLPLLMRVIGATPTHLVIDGGQVVGVFCGIDVAVAPTTQKRGSASSCPRSVSYRSGLQGSYEGTLKGGSGIALDDSTARSWEWRVDLGEVRSGTRDLFERAARNADRQHAGDFRDGKTVGAGEHGYGPSHRQQPPPPPNEALSNRRKGCHRRRQRSPNPAAGAPAARVRASVIKLSIR